MKSKIKSLLNKFGYSLQKLNNVNDDVKLKLIYSKYKDFTMIPEYQYSGNLRLCDGFKNIEGLVVECGVWRGGMTAGIAEIIGTKKKYLLFDSFEGLPEVKENDGKSAAEWQMDVSGENYYDNCKADISYADNAMKLAGVDYELIKGWFNETLPRQLIIEPISILRLDGDWYDSTIECLKHLYPKVNKNGLIILDDYYTWDGCSKAIHDYLSSINSISRIYSTKEGICYIIKNDRYHGK